MTICQCRQVVAAIYVILAGMVVATRMRKVACKKTDGVILAEMPLNAFGCVIN